MNSEFVQGLKLSELFFNNIVKKILCDAYPNLSYTAGLIGSGSEVLCFDDIVSSDHHWGLRLHIFISLEDYEKHSDDLNDLFRKKLPFEYNGYSTNWSQPDPDDNGTQIPQLLFEGEVNHRIEIHTKDLFLKDQLDIVSTDLTDIDWLLIPEQKLLEFTSGKIFYDTLEEISEIRDKLAYFPQNVWRYKIMSEWVHIDQEIAFAGRTGEVGDELGSKIESSRLMRYIMRLAFLLEKTYTPYEKWFGTAFSKLNVSKKLEPLLLSILDEKDWKKRDNLLCKAYMLLVEEQNKLGITPIIEVEPKPYFNRKMTIIDTGKIINSLKESIKSPLDKIQSIGSVDQLLTVGGGMSATFAKKARIFYEK